MVLGKVRGQVARPTNTSTVRRGGMCSSHTPLRAAQVVARCFGCRMAGEGEGEVRWGKDGWTRRRRVSRHDTYAGSGKLPFRRRARGWVAHGWRRASFAWLCSQRFIDACFGRRGEVSPLPPPIDRDINAVWTAPAVQSVRLWQDITAQ